MEFLQAAIGGAVFGFVFGVIVGALGIAAVRRRNRTLAHRNTHLLGTISAMRNHIADQQARIESEVDAADWWKREDA